MWCKHCCLEVKIRNPTWFPRFHDFHNTKTKEPKTCENPSLHSLWNENKNTPYGHKQFHGVTREGQSRITPEDQEHAHSYTSWGGQAEACGAAALLHRASLSLFWLKVCYLLGKGAFTSIHHHLHRGKGVSGPGQPAALPACISSNLRPKPSALIRDLTEEPRRGDLAPLHGFPCQPCCLHGAYAKSPIPLLTSPIFASKPPKTSW